MNENKICKKVLFSLFVGVVVFLVGIPVVLSISPVLLMGSLDADKATIIGLGLYIAAVIASCMTMIYCREKNGK